MNISRWTRSQAPPSVPPEPESTRPEPRANGVDVRPAWPAYAGVPASEAPAADEYGPLGDASADRPRLDFVTEAETVGVVAPLPDAMGWPQFPTWSDPAQDASVGERPRREGEVTQAEAEVETPSVQAGKRSPKEASVDVPPQDHETADGSRAEAPQAVSRGPRRQHDRAVRRPACRCFRRGCPSAIDLAGRHGAGHGPAAQCYGGPADPGEEGERRRRGAD